MNDSGVLRVRRGSSEIDYPKDVRPVFTDSGLRPHSSAKGKAGNSGLCKLAFRIDTIDAEYYLWSLKANLVQSARSMFGNEEGPFNCKRAVPGLKQLVLQRFSLISE